MSIKFEHVGLYTDDIDRVLKFYEEVLGFETVFRHEGEGTRAAVQKLGDMQLEVIQMDSIPNADDANSKCHMHIDFMVTDMDALVEKIRAWGCEIVVEPFMHENRKVSLFRGPCREYTELNEMMD